MHGGSGSHDPLKQPGHWQYSVIFTRTPVQSYSTFLIIASIKDLIYIYIYWAQAIIRLAYKTKDIWKSSMIF